MPPAIDLNPRGDVYAQFVVVCRESKARFQQEEAAATARRKEAELTQAHNK